MVTNQSVLLVSPFEIGCEPAVVINLKLFEDRGSPELQLSSQIPASSSIYNTPTSPTVRLTRP